MGTMCRVMRLLRSIGVTAVLLALPVLAYAQTQRHGGPRDRSMTSAFLVTRFGAKCDGNTDDTRAFQAALNAAGAGCSAGKGYLDSGYQTVLVPDGVKCRI